MTRQLLLCPNRRRSSSTTASTPVRTATSTTGGMVMVASYPTARRRRRKRVCCTVALTCLLSTRLIASAFQPLPLSLSLASNSNSNNDNIKRTLSLSLPSSRTTPTPPLLYYHSPENTMTATFSSSSSYRLSSLLSKEQPSMLLRARGGLASTSSLQKQRLPPITLGPSVKGGEDQRLKSRGGAAVLGFAMNDYRQLGGGGQRSASSSTSTTTPDQQNQQQQIVQRQRRHDTAQSARTTNVDLSAWNVQDEQFSEQNTDAGQHIQWMSRSTTSILSKNTEHFLPDSSWHQHSLSSSTSGTMAVPSSSSSSSSPWMIPTLTQIQALKVAELKQVCAERGLSQSGRKAELQERLIEWTRQQQLQLPWKQQQQRTSSLNLLQAYGVDNNKNRDKLKKDALSYESTQSRHSASTTNQESASSAAASSPNSLAEWARTVDLGPLLHRRHEIRQEQLQGKKVTKRQRDATSSSSSNSSEHILVQLKKLFDKPSSPYSNREVKLLYQAAKHADQIGDRALTRRILLQLKECTPHDARVYRRLSRLEKEEGNIAAARAVLQEGLRLHHSNNAYLWHGLGQIAASQPEAVKCYRKAIQLDPSLPHSYHALGTLLHTTGRIANAMQILKKGVEYCPKNHRLHHALGDLYRDAKMLDMAERSYRRALQYSPPCSHGFAYTALAYTAYDLGNVSACRSWLLKAVALNSNHANAWVALAQLEESQGNIEAARTACVTGLAQYEKRLLQRYRPATNTVTSTTNTATNSSSSSDASLSSERLSLLLQDPVAAKKALFSQVPSYRSGDRFFNLYRNWARLEERYGSIDSVDAVYERASLAFLREWKITVDWAEYYAALKMPGRARALLAESCARSTTKKKHADPYRLFAQFEMNLGNYTAARKILYAGCMSLTQDDESAGGAGCCGSQIGLAELFQTWAVCEWHLGELSRAENLLDHALRMTPADESGRSLRAYILYTIAMLEHCRGEHVLAQHCIGLCLKENSLPGGNARVWNLWTAVAEELGNTKLANECREQATLALREAGSSKLVARLLNHGGIVGHEQLVRRDPWHQEIFGTGEKPSKFYYAVRFPFRVASYVRQEKGNVMAPARQ